MKRRKCSFKVGTPSRRELDASARVVLTASSPRVSKSEAARILGINRRTVIRYAAARLISENRRGRVRVREVAVVLTKIPIRQRYHARRITFTLTNRDARARIHNIAHCIPADGFRVTRLVAG